MALRFRASLLHHIRQFSRKPFIVLLGTMAMLAGFIVTFDQTAKLLSNYYSETIGWKGKEQTRISKLTANAQIDYFRSVLGQPIMISAVDELNENIFKMKGYWVQALSDKSGTVVLYAITVCDPNFKPIITTPYLNKQLKLGSTKMDNVFDEEPSKLRYFISGATSPSYLLDEYYRGNPSGYSTMFAGINDSCPMLTDERLGYDVSLKIGKDGWNMNDPDTVHLRKTTTVNTYAETSTGYDIKKENFIIGPDRQRIRLLLRK